MIGTDCLCVTYLPSDESVNSNESREQLKIIAKLFLEVPCAEVVEEAVLKGAMTFVFLDFEY